MGLDTDRFTTELPHHLICTVCLNAATSPHVVCDPEQHLLCHDCVMEVDETAFRNGEPPTCPVCRAAFQPKSSRVLERALEEYAIRCARSVDGCDWIGSVKDEEGHKENACLCRIIACPCCHLNQLAKDVPHHLASTCPEQIVQCVRGGIDCGGVKNNGKFARKNSEAHDALCGEYLCGLGCGTRTTLHRYKEHRTACLATQRVKEDALRQMEAANEEVARLRAEIARNAASSSRASASSSSRRASTSAETLDLTRSSQDASRRCARVEEDWSLSDSEYSSPDWSFSDSESETSSSDEEPPAKKAKTARRRD